jgi:DNA-binding response OmpR family regulator
MARVLVIDDDPFTAMLAAAKVEQLGHTVRIAADGEEGLALIERWQPDLLLLDLLMPRMGGLELCRLVRASRAGHHLPIVILTGIGTERDVEEGFAAGATDYLAKPFSPLELQVRIRAALERTESVV